LWKNPDKLTERQQHQLDSIAEHHPTAWRAYRLKEGLRYVFAVKGDEVAKKHSTVGWHGRAAPSSNPSLSSPDASAVTPPPSTSPSPKDSLTAASSRPTPRSGCSPASPRIQEHQRSDSTRHARPQGQPSQPSMPSGHPRMSEKSQKLAAASRTAGRGRATPVCWYEVGSVTSGLIE
jgi:hypothetical protein